MTELDVSSLTRTALWEPLLIAGHGETPGPACVLFAIPVEDAEHSVCAAAY